MFVKNDTKIIDIFMLYSIQSLLVNPNMVGFVNDA